MLLPTASLRARRRRRTTPRRCSFSVEALEPRQLLAADPVISEFLASNDGNLLDGNGNTSDWIELFNRGDESVNLQGWRLTDDADDLTKWTFPDQQLGAGEFLVVFASGDGTPDPNGNPHTNFQLDAAGEYLALVKPDGETVVSSYGGLAEPYPDQRKNISFGIRQVADEVVMVPEGATGEILVPQAEVPDWNQIDFTADGAWQQGATPIGFDVNTISGGEGGGGETVLAIDVNQRANDIAANTQAGFQSFVMGGSGIQTGNITRAYGDIDVTISGIDDGYDDRFRPDPLNGGGFTESALLRDFIFSREINGVGGLDVLVGGLSAGQFYTLTVWSFDTGSAGPRQADWYANGRLASSGYHFDGGLVPPSPPTNEEYQFSVTVAANQQGEILLSGRRDEASLDSAGAESFGVFLNALKVETAPAPSVAVPILRLDFNDADEGEAGSENTESGFAAFTLDDNGVRYGGVTVTLSPLGGATLDDRDRNAPTPNPPHLTQDQLYDDFVFGSGTSDGDGLQILLEGLTPLQTYDLTLWSFDATSPGERYSVWREVGSGAPLDLDASYNFDGNILPTQDGLNTIQRTVTASADGALQIQGVRNGGASHGVFLNALQLSTRGFGELIETDLEEQMLNSSTTAYLRIPFDAPEGEVFDILRLNVTYDDGFIAYLNGQEVARRNVPGPPGEALPVDAEALTSRSSSEVLIRESINLSSSIADLITGDHGGMGNLLAIQAVNYRADDGDFLLNAELVGTTISELQEGYFRLPTPGRANSEGIRGFVSDTRFSADRGFYDAPFEVEISSETPGAEIYFTVDGSEPAPGNPSAALHAAPIAVATTTTLRAAAFLDDFAPSNVDTQTYIFLDDVLNQDPLSQPGDLIYPTVWQANAAADYTLDPEIVSQWDDNNPGNTDYGIREALQSLPTMSIVLDHEDLWGASSGIYNHATSTGDSWRRPGSIEYFDPQSGDQFQYNVGVQMHGGASRDNVRLKKHSFRLIFSDEFNGPTELDYPLFDNSDLDRINTVVMRASFTDAFATRTQTGRYSPLDSQYTRDVWMRDTQLAMGHPSAASTFVHLYINGLYWGMYSPAERPDDAFQAAYNGGNREDYDIVKDFNELFAGNTDAWNQMFDLADQLLGPNPDAIYQQLMGNQVDGAPDATLPNLLDMENLIDYMILHLYGGAEDWPHHNWYAARNRVEETKGFQFFVWDQEIVLDGRFRDLTEVGAAANHDHTPAELYDKLQRSPEFRQRFADRVQLHFFNGGALSTAENQQRWMARADQVEAAIIGESARWGDAREGEVVRIDSGQPSVTIPTMTVDHWRAERDNVRDNYFPQSWTLALNRFRADGLFPALDAPRFNQHGGVVTSGFQVTLADPSPDASHAIYYRLDGGDPRELGGTVSPDTLVYSSELTLDETTLIRARTFNVATGEWSPVVEATFVINPAVAGKFAITEVNYNPAPPTAEEIAAIPAVTNDDFEFIELQNLSPQTLDLTGVRFVDGIDYDFTQAAVFALEPGQFVLLVRNENAFLTRYGDSLAPRIAGQFSGGLNNNGEDLELLDRFGQVIHLFEYNDSGNWPGRADGAGATLEILDPAADYNDGANWRSSSEYLGSPGATGLGGFRDVVINEVLAHTDPPQSDTIELHNTTAAPVDIGGWWLSDTSGDYQKFQIPLGTSIPGGGYLNFDETDFNSSLGLDPRDFALSGKQGDDVWLMAVDGNGRIARFADHVDFLASLNGESFGRWPNGDGDLYPMSRATLGAENAGPRVGPLVISEVMYNPVNTDDQSELTQLEFVEIHNPTAATVDMTGWRLSGGVDYAMASGSSLEPGGVLVIVGFDPDDQASAALLAEFRQAYGLDATVAIAGGFSGQLDNGGERVRLRRPDEPPLDEPDFTPLVLEDEVRYDDQDPWPAAADGGGFSLNRTASDAWGNDALSWIAVEPTPGTAAYDSGPLVVLSVAINKGLVDPADLPSGSQPSNWQTQRSDLRAIQVAFNRPVLVATEHLSLINLGVNAPQEADQSISLTEDHWNLSGNLLTFEFAAYELPSGAYQLVIGAEVTDLDGNPLDGNQDGTAGDAYVLTANSENRFYKIAGEYNGDGGVTIFDFPTFSYWFGATAGPNGPGPEYADLNADGGITIFDFPLFAANFGQGIVFPPALAAQSVMATDQPNRRPIEKAINLEVQQRVERPVQPIEQLGPRNSADSQRLLASSAKAREVTLEEILEQIAGDISRRR